MHARRHWLAAGAAATLAALATPPRAAAPPATRRARLPNVELTTHTGRSVRFHDDLVRGRVVVVNMMYANCNQVCPPMTRNLLRVQQLLGPRAGREVFMYSISLQPEQDGVDELAWYAKQHGVGPGWWFLTGRPDNIAQVRRALGFFDVDPERDALAATHTGMVRIGNDALDRWGMAPALAEPAQIIAAIRHVDRRGRI
jgi:protein SCO1